MEKLFFWLKEKKFVCSTVFFVSLWGIFTCLYFSEVSAEEAYVCPKTIAYDEVEEKEPEEEVIIVDIKGAVVNPGVYRTTSKSIVNDVITLAGGLTSDADTTNLNLSKAVSNEMVITVYKKDEINSQKNEAIQEEKKPLKNEETTLVSLNKATLEELLTLPGVGEAKAKLIIQYRESCGPFEHIEELKNIKGIGESVYEKLEAYITI